jgi:hypothetical protein
VEQRYSVAAVAPTWEHALREAAGLSGTGPPPTHPRIEEEALR